jgi:hypothetical protein
MKLPHIKFEDLKEEFKSLFSTLEVNNFVSYEDLEVLYKRLIIYL